MASLMSLALAAGQLQTLRLLALAAGQLQTLRLPQVSRLGFWPPLPFAV
jgi:hypothetical protein